MVHLKDEIKADIDEEQSLALLHCERWVKFLDFNCGEILDQLIFNLLLTLL